jgi:hypothetical protein
MALAAQNYKTPENQHENSKSSLGPPVGFNTVVGANLQCDSQFYQ